MLRRTWGATVLLLLALAPLLAAASGSALRVRVGIYENAPKVAYLGSDHPQGIFVDVIEAIARQEHWSIEYVPGTFKEGLQRLERGELDLMVDVARTPERERMFRFHQEVVLHSWNQVYARPHSGIRTVLDLAGRRVAVLDGSVQQQQLSQMAASFGVRPILLPFSDYGAAEDAVARGRADALVTNPFYGSSRARAAGLEDTAIIFSPIDLYFAAPRAGDPALLSGIDRQLRAMLADPRSAYFASLGRWTRRSRAPASPGWLEPAALGTFALLLLAVSWAFTLRRIAAKLRGSEAAQRQFAEELGRIFDQSLDAICVLDGEFRLVRVSRACEQLWGYTADELKGRLAVDLVPPADRSATRRALMRVRQGASSRSLEGRALRKDGSTASLLWSAVWSERQQEMYCIARDDTERRTLICRLQARTAELQLANDDLQTFSQSVSHDLRAPVSVVSGFLSKVLRDSRSELGARTEHLLERSLAATVRMDQLIEDLLRLARISEHGVRRRRCDLGAMAREVAETLRQSHGSKPDEVDFSAADDLWASADPQLLRIALENLIGNAWKFSARAARPKIEFGRESGEGEQVFFVRDNGAGFQMEHASRIFAPFRRLHAQDEFPGTGIGLSIVNRVITGHGGRIWADSAPGRGAIFRFTLGRGPLAPLD